MRNKLRMSFSRQAAWSSIVNFMKVDVEICEKISTEDFAFSYNCDLERSEQEKKPNRFCFPLTLRVSAKVKAAECGIKWWSSITSLNMVEFGRKLCTQCSTLVFAQGDRLTNMTDCIDPYVTHTDQSIPVHQQASKQASKQEEESPGLPTAVSLTGP